MKKMNTTYLADELGGGPPEAQILGATAQDDETLIVRWCCHGRRRGEATVIMDVDGVDRISGCNLAVADEIKRQVNEVRAAARAGLCLATTVTDSYVPGAVAMLGSFRAHHPEFEGDVVVLHNGLSEESRRVLSTVGGPVRFEPVRPALVERVAHLATAYPGRLHSQATFHTIDAFRLGGYRKVLFYDSDVLFQGPVGELFDTDAALLCCGDLDLAMGKVRDAETLQPIARTAAGAGQGRPVLERPFNCGFLLIDRSCTGERVYEDLLARMAPEEWRGAVIRFGDQALLNRYFEGRQTLASWTYNYFVPQAAALHAHTGLDAARAKVLHFKGPVKPWAPDAMMRWALGDDEPPAHRPAGALFRRWHHAYVEILERTHQRSASQTPAKESVAPPARGKRGDGLAGGA